MEPKEKLYRENFVRRLNKAGIPQYVEISTPLSEEDAMEAQQQSDYLAQKLAPENFESLRYDAKLAGMSPEQYRKRLQEDLDSLQTRLSRGAVVQVLPSQQNYDYLMDDYIDAKIKLDDEREEANHQNIQHNVHLGHWKTATGVLSFVSVFLALCLVLNIITVEDKTTSIAVSPPASSTPTASSLPPATVSDDKPKDYPASGEVLYRDCNYTFVAPLKIKTSGTSTAYYVKMVDARGRSVLGFFIRPGETAEVEMPLGNYYLRYACGTEWYGQKELFGAETVAFKGTDVFRFTEDNEGYNGYSVTLYKVPNGNFETTEMDVDDF